MVQVFPLVDGQLTTQRFAMPAIRWALTQGKPSRLDYRGCGTSALRYRPCLV